MWWNFTKHVTLANFIVPEVRGKLSLISAGTELVLNSMKIPH